jgi:hypothetical protein
MEAGDAYPGLPPVLIFVIITHLIKIISVIEYSNAGDILGLHVYSLPFLAGAVFLIVFMALLLY